MATLTPLHAESFSLAAIDGNSSAVAANDTTGTLSDTLSNTNTDFATMLSLSWLVRYNQSGRVDDTMSLGVRIVNGATILAAANSGGAFATVNSNVTNTSMQSSSVTAFAYVNTTADKATWDGASVELQQTYSQNMGKDGMRVNADYVEFTGTYTIATGAALKKIQNETVQPSEVILRPRGLRRLWAETAELAHAELAVRGIVMQHDEQESIFRGLLWEDLFEDPSAPQSLVDYDIGWNQIEDPGGGEFLTTNVDGQVYVDNPGVEGWWRYLYDLLLFPNSIEIILEGFYETTNKRRWCILWMDSGNGYGFELTNDRNGGAFQASIQRWDSSTPTDIATVTTGAPANGTLIKMKLRIDGGTLKAKWWPIASAEPNTWNIETTDPNHIGFRNIGMGMYADTLAFPSLDNLEVHELATDAMHFTSTAFTKVVNETLNLEYPVGAGFTPATLLANSFEGGTNGVDLTGTSGGNTGGASGSFLDVIGKSGAATSKFTTSDKAHGSVGWEGIANSGEFNYLEWGTSYTAASEKYFRFYFKTSDETPAANFAIFRLDNGGSPAGDVQLRTNGTLALRDAGLTARYFSPAISPNTWYRIEIRWVHSATVGHMQMRIYNVIDSQGTPWATVGSATDNWNTQTQSTLCRFGIASNPGQTITIRLDDIATASAAQGWIGPVALVGESQEALRVLGRVKQQAETIQLSETILRALGLTRIINEVEELSEVTLRFRNLLRLQNEAEEIGETDVKIRGLSRVQNEVVELGETVSRHLELVRLLDETLQISETDLRVKGLVRIVAEALEISETDLFTRQLVRLVSETLEISEQVLRFMALSKIYNETVEVSESILRTLALVKQQSESIEISESVLRALGLTRVENESVEISETELKILVSELIIKIQNETVELSDTDLRFLGKVRVEGESVEISETDLSFKGLLRLVSESIEVSETDLRFRSLIREYSETINISEEVLRFLTLVRLNDETVEIGELTISALSLSRIVNEGVEISETDLTFKGLFRVQDESVEISGTDLTVAGIFRVQTEAVEMAETNLHLLGLVRLRNETVEISENIQRVMSLIRAINETEEIAEQTLKFLALVKVHDEVVQLSEQSLSLLDLLRIVSETVEISEAEIHVVTSIGNVIIKVVDENIEISEGILSYEDLVRLQTETVEISESIVKLQILTRIQNETIQIPENVITARELLRIQNEIEQVAEQVINAQSLLRIHNSSIDITKLVQYRLGKVVVLNESLDISEVILNIVGAIIPTPPFIRAQLTIAFKFRDFITDPSKRDMLIDSSVRDMIVD